MTSDPASENAIDVQEVSKIPDEEINSISPTQTEDEAFRVQKLREGDLRIDQLKQDLDERKRYAAKIYRLIALWLGSLGFILLLQGVKLPKDFFTLSDSVLLALIGGTTANVLGMFFIVLKYLFPQQDTKT